MKGKDIISYAQKDKMPDMKEVLDNCIMERKVTTWRFSRIAINLAAVLVFATVIAGVWTAYMHINGDGIPALRSSQELYEGYPRFDSGLAFGAILLPEGYDDDLDLLENNEYGFSSNYILVVYYTNIHSDVLWQFHQMCNNRQFGPLEAQAIREMAHGRVFTADGTHFELLRDVNNGLYQSNPNRVGEVLYDTYGNEIGAIILIYRRGYFHGSFLDRIIITTREDFEARRGYNTTIDDVTELFNTTIALPSFEGFEHPRMQITEFTINLPDNMTEEWLPFHGQAVSIRYICIEEPGWQTEITLQLTHARALNTEPSWVRMAGDFTIVEYEVAGILVRGLSEGGRIYSLSWVQNHVVFNLNAPSDFSIDQTLEIIQRIIEIN
ncbi:MAG: hypothetical protein FWE11_03355 [Defluviitaleaceae bacterium]|nr:hypothetical protein [Defluviitaleaceae bacterium]